MLAMRSSRESGGNGGARPARALALVTAAVAAVALVALPAAAQQSAGSYGGGYDDGNEQAGYDSGYSYVRNLRGSATLVEGDTRDRQTAEVNQPVLAGDRLAVSPGSMAELLLSDGNLLRVDGDSEVLLARLAGSPETRDEVTELVLVEGNVQLVVFADAAGRELPRIELPDATVYVSEAGAYRLTAGRGWSQVVARSGWAEVATDRGSVVVRAGEEAVLDGGRGGADVRVASYRDDLERWGERLDQQVADSRYVDRSLRYQTAALDGYGSWIDDGGRHAWRPRVGSDWHPYWHGRWRHTPLGLTWVSSEPWGWAPYHYGTWDFHPRWGWVWYPGTAFAPAWVYWYWGPEHVAWVPIGYYTHHYRHYRHGFRFGVYGWAGGHWGLFNDWVFCSTGSFGRGFGNRHFWRGRDWRHHHGDRDVPRGIIAIDTRPLGRDDWRDGQRAMRVLSTRPNGGGVAGRTADLPDVTDFVARKRALPDQVAERVFVDDGAARRVRVAGTPLAPDDATATAARPRVVPREGSIDGGSGARGDDDGGARVRVTPRGPAAEVPSAGEGSPGVRPRMLPRTTEPQADGGEGRPTSGVRPRTIEPQAGGGEERPTSGLRPRTIEPREPGGGSSPASPATPAVRPRTIEPRESGGPAPGARATDPDLRPRTIEPRESGGPAADRSAPTVRPRSIEPRRPAGDPARPAEPAPSRPVVRPQGDDGRGDGGRGDGGAFRSSEPRRVTPDSYARSPRSVAPERPEVVVPPRSERRGVESAPPARRVVTGVREAPRSSRSAPPSVRPSSPPPAPRASTPSSSSGSRSGSPGVRSRSDGGGSGRASAGSGSSSRSSGGDGGGRARATRRGGGGGDDDRDE